MKLKKRLPLPLCLIALPVSVLVCLCVGTVPVSAGVTVDVLRRALLGLEQTDTAAAAILLSVRLPRVLCAALSGAALSVCGAAMQGLLRNPLADGSTLGVSSGASLGAVLALLLGISFPELPFSGTMLMACLFAFLSMTAVLLLSWRMDRSLATGTIVLIGVVFSMFVSALLNLLITFAGDRLRTITFWTMGSLASASYANAAVLAVVFAVCFPLLWGCGGALDALTMGEEQASHLGVAVRRVRLTVMIAASVLIGVCVAIGGCIGFVGLVVPHMLRLTAGPAHRRLLPLSALGGAVFLLWCDLAARTLLSPLVLPVGTVTSLIGAVVFLVIFVRSRRVGRA